MPKACILAYAGCLANPDAAVYSQGMYEVFEHTADLGLRVRAPDLETLFAEAGRALFATIADLDEVRPLEQLTLKVEGEQRDYLLFDWLNELLYTFESRRLLLSKFDVRFNAEGLSAEVSGEPLDPSRHRLDHEVKAITYHGLRVEPCDEGWLAEVIIDI